MKKVIIFLMIFLMFLVSVDVYGKLELWEIKCEDNGRLTLTLWARDSNRTNTEDIEVRAKSFNLVTYEKDDFIVEGNWDIPYLKLDTPTRRYEKGVFTSKEASLNKRMNYDIEINYDNQKIETNVDCPGLIFSCALLNLAIENCTTKDGYFLAYLDIKGLNQSLDKSFNVYEDLTYNIRANERYFDIHGEYSEEGSLPKDAIIKNVDKDKYLIEYDFKRENFVESLVVEFKDLYECRNKKEYKNVSLREYKECNVIYIVEQPVIKPKEEINESIEEIIEPIEIEEKIETEKNNKLLILIIGISFILVIIILIALLNLKKKETKDEWFKDVQKRLEKEK